jgi:hypothetical protein
MSEAPDLCKGVCIAKGCPARCLHAHAEKNHKPEQIAFDAAWVSFKAELMTSLVSALASVVQWIHREGDKK